MEVGGHFDHDFDSNHKKELSKNKLPQQIIKITPHAGGLEAKDFCNIVLRMLEKFLINKKIKYSILEHTEYIIQIGIEAPIGILDFFTGFLKLVRVSPFGKGDKLHTSLCKLTIDVIDEKSKEKPIIFEKDLHWNYFKAPGPGGQHKNKTMSAVRLTHIPTSVTVISCGERSQNDNKRKALEQLEVELLKKKQNTLNEIKKANWENAIKPEDANISFYFNHQLVCHEKNGVKSKKLKEILNGRIDYLQK